MTAFSYTTGDINDLTGGADALMNDIQGPLLDLRTFLNSGTMDETNVPNLAAAFTTWKTIAWGGAGIPQQGAGGTLLIPGGPTASATSSVSAVGGASTGGFVMDFDPADWLANSRTTKLRLTAVMGINSTAPAQTFTIGLYPAATFGGGAGAFQTVASLGTVITGSTVVFTTPAANSRTKTRSTEFNAPTAGPYVLGVVVGGGMAANSTCMMLVQLQMRQL